MEPCSIFSGLDIKIDRALQVLYHQSVLEIINLLIYHSVLLIGLLSCRSSKLSFRQACYTGETDVHTAARSDFEDS